MSNSTTCSASLERLVEGVVDVSNQILGVFQTDGEPQMAVFLEIRRITIGAAAPTATDMDDQALVMTKRDGGRDDSEMCDEPVLRIGIAIDGKSHDRAVALASKLRSG